MSSEESAGSNSSRLRQFGLYRNIEDRTEEFLKLSRKRQIRQGCACAAVSTAITVTVVVSVLIVFEYGFHSDPEPTLQPKNKPNWLSMLNDSEVKFDGNQHANLKSSVILPLLLKALKQNRILEKAIEEYSSNTPNYEKDATDYPLERNVFTDARNWLRMPPARMYAIEYKTSPIVFFKSRNIDDFSRARKIMDFRRVTNYLDRMINNDKAAYVARGTTNGETDTTVKKIVPTARPERATTHFARLEEPKKSTTKKDKATTTKKLHFSNCDCPSNLKHILQTLLLGVQKLYSMNNKNPIVASEDCGSATTRAPKRQAKTYDDSRRTITTKRTPRATITHSYLPLNFFKRIIIPKASSTTKLLDILGRTKQSTTESIYHTSSLISETTSKQNDANDNDNVNEITTFKPYLEVPYYTTIITRTKPMTPVPTEHITHRVRTTGHFMKGSQNTPPPKYINYNLNDFQLNPNSLIPTNSSTYDEVWTNEEDEENKNKTPSHFLFKYKESQKNSNKIEDNTIEMSDNQPLDSETMRNFNARNKLTRGGLKVRPRIKFSMDRKKVNGSAFLKSKSKIAATKDEFGSVIRELTAWNVVPFNITYGSIQLPNDSNEKPISALPQHNPPFLQTRRRSSSHEGGQEDNDYYSSTGPDLKQGKKSNCSESPQEGPHKNRR